MWEKEFFYQSSLCFVMYCVNFVQTQSALFLHLRGSVHSAVCRKGSFYSCRNVGIPELYHENNTKSTKSTKHVFPGKCESVLSGWESFSTHSALCFASYVFGSRARLTFSTGKHWDLLYVCTCWEHLNKCIQRSVRYSDWDNVAARVTQILHKRISSVSNLFYFHLSVSVFYFLILPLFPHFLPSSVTVKHNITLLFIKHLWSVVRDVYCREWKSRLKCNRGHSAAYIFSWV